MKSSSEALKAFCKYYVVKNKSVRWYKDTTHPYSHTSVMDDMKAYARDFNLAYKNYIIVMADMAELTTRFIKNIKK